MEIERRISIRKTLAGIGMAVAVSASPNVHYQNQEQLFDLRDNSPNSRLNDMPEKENVLFLANTETAPPLSTLNLSLSSTPPFQETPSPSPEPTLSPKELREQKIKLELSEINKILDAHPNVFSRKYKKDINLYYPIYKPIADKFHIDWYLIFIVHEKETGASAGTRGFLPSSYYKGAMQRDPILWDEDYVKEAVKELEYLKDLPQRHSDDWREIATGAAILNRNIDFYARLGKNMAVFNSIRIYSPGSYDERFELYEKYKSLFD